MTENIQTENPIEGQPAIRLTDLQFGYDQSQHTPILDIQNWQVMQGTRLFIYGSSGSGKSTLLNLLGGLLVPQQGTVEILGQTISSMKGARRDSFRAQHIGMIFQQFNLIPWLSVRDNIAVAHYFSKSADARQEVLDEKILELLTQLQLPESIIKRKTAELSIGQQQRVAIARALVNNPEIIIADEPTSSLDADARDSFIQLLFKLVESNNSTLVFVSHDRHLASHFSELVDLQELNQVGETVDHVA